MFELSAGSLVPSESVDSTVHLHVNPDAAERDLLRAFLRIDDHTLSSALDPDEISRLEVNADHTFLIWKLPTNYSGGETFFFNVASVGLFLSTNQLVIIVTEDIELPTESGRQTQAMRTPLDVTLAILLNVIRHYMGHLKVIRMIARDLQEKINSSMENKHLIQMFNLSESLVYYLNGINSNGVVLTRLRSHGEKAGFSPEVLAFMDDLIIENNQCYKQAEIYSTVLSGLMDARGTLVNNNMNILLKNLTIINVVFLPLNLIASVGGMSEFSMMTQGIDWRITYSLFFVAMVAVAWFTAFALRRVNFGTGSPDTPKRVKKGRRATSTFTSA
jgi:magnesium transporter